MNKISGYVAIFIVVFSLGVAAAESAVMQSSIVNTHASRGDVTAVEGATAELVRSDAGLTMNFFAKDLIPGHAYTAWWVIINEPQNCETQPCTAADVLSNTELVKANAANASGAVADENGIANFFAHLSPGALSNAWWSSDLSDPYTVEVHIALNDHGPMIEGMHETMTSTYRGGCTDESLPEAFPESAKTDGTPGPNSCQLFQFAIFE